MSKVFYLKQPRTEAEIAAQIDRLSEEIAEKIDSYESDTSDNNPYAEFVRSIGYGEGEIDLDGIMRVDNDLWAELRKLSEAELKELIDACSDIEIHSSYYSPDETVFAHSIGEVELFLSEAPYCQEISDALDAYFPYPESEVCYVDLSGTVVCLVLDTEAAWEYLERLNKAA